MRRTSINSFVSIVSLVIAIVSSVALASPSRLITRPPVVPGPNPLTGPIIDPNATQGQWFQRLSTGALESRAWEYYDNNDTPGAVGFQDIRGTVGNIVFTGGNISGFQIVASITNNIQPDLGLPGRNTHNESLAPGTSFQGTMFNVKMTTEFAFPSQVTVPANVLNQIAAGTLPYTTPNYGGQPATIIAQNEDQEAWYCYTPGAAGGGGFHVPTYDFGNIAPGATATRTLSFAFGGTGLTPAHPLFPQLLGWQQNQTDVLMNRTTDLKIGDWVDVLAADSPTPYPVPAFESGNVSVFFNAVPEPTTIAMLAPMGLVALRRRSRLA